MSGNRYQNDVDGASDRSHATAVAAGADAARLLTLLEESHDGELSAAELRDRGISAPAHAIYMLQLAGYEVARAPNDSRRGSAAYRLHPGAARIQPLVPRMDR